MTENTKAEDNRGSAARFSDSIPLVEPIVRGETTIDSLTLRKPKSGELRGLTLTDLLTSDVGTIITLVPRISDPILTEFEARDLDPADLAQIGGAIRGFFLTPAERDLIERMTANGSMSATPVEKRVEAEYRLKRRLPDQLDRARNRVRALENMARNYGMHDLVQDRAP